MNTQHSFLKLLRSKPLLFGVVCLLSSCGEKKGGSNTEGGGRGKPTITQLENQLATGPTDFTRRYQDSKINWQNWNHEVFAEAKKQQKPIMALITSGRYTESFNVLKDLEESEELRTKLDGDFISCFIDTHAYPEMATVAYGFSTSGGGFSLPYIIWFTPDGDPMSWHSLQSAGEKSSALTLLSMANSVNDTWSRDQEYSLKHSKKTHESLLKLNTPLILEESEDKTVPHDLYAQTMRKLLALYDPVDNTIDGVGSLIPYNMLESFDDYHYYSDKDSALDRRAQDLIAKATPSYLITPLKDPLDKGFFYAKFGNGWDFPNFTKTLETQASLINLLNYPSIARSIPSAQDYVEDATTYIREVLTNPDETVSSYIVVEGIEQMPDYHLWSVKELKEILSAPEFKAVKFMSNLSERGNISATSDPLKRYYRKNTLAELHPRSKTANALGVSVADLNETLASAWAKIGEAREKRAVEMNNLVFRENTGSVSIQAKAVQAYLSAYQVNKNKKNLVKAKIILDLMKKDFWKEETGLLRIVARDSGSESISARGFDYVAVIRTYLLAHKITLESDYLAFAQTLSQEAHDALADENGFLSEVAKKDHPIRGSIYHYTMLFGDSTLGTLPFLLAQLGELTQDEKLMSTGDNTFPAIERGLKQMALVHTDFLKSYPVPLGEVIILTGDPTNSQTQTLKKVLQSPRFNNYQFFHYSEGSTAKMTLEINNLNQPAIHFFKKGKSKGTAQSAQQLIQLLKKN